MDTDCVSCGLLRQHLSDGCDRREDSPCEAGPMVDRQRSDRSAHYCGDRLPAQLRHLRRLASEGVTLTKQDCRPTATTAKKGRFGYNYVQAPERLRLGKIRTGPASSRIPRWTRRSATRRHAPEGAQAPLPGKRDRRLRVPAPHEREAYLAQKFAARGPSKTHQCDELRSPREPRSLLSERSSRPPLTATWSTRRRSSW